MDTGGNSSDCNKNKQRLQELKDTPKDLLTKAEIREMKSLEKKLKSGCMSMGISKPIVVTKVEKPQEETKKSEKKRKKSKGKQGFCFNGRQ